MGDSNFLVFSTVIPRTLGTLNGNIGQKWIKLHSMGGSFAALALTNLRLAKLDHLLI